MTDRWRPGSLADDMSRLVFGVEKFNRDAVRDYCDRVEALDLALVEARRMLGECYLLSGADPDGDTVDGPHLWRDAVEAVRELRRESDDDSEVARLSARVTALESAITDVCRQPGDDPDPLRDYRACRRCGATSLGEAEGKCVPTQDQSGEYTCPGTSHPLVRVWGDGGTSEPEDAYAVMLGDAAQHWALVAHHEKAEAARLMLEVKRLREQAEAEVQRLLDIQTAARNALVAADVWMEPKADGTTSTLADGVNVLVDSRAAARAEVRQLRAALSDTVETLNRGMTNTERGLLADRLERLVVAPPRKSGNPSWWTRCVHCGVERPPAALRDPAAHSYSCPTRLKSLRRS